MNYEQLRRYQRKEKNTANLVELKKDFYTELSDLIKKLEKKYQENTDPQTKKKLENIKKIAKDLYRKRERKILSRTLKTDQPNQEDYNLLPNEEKAFKEIRKTLEKQRENLNTVLQGERIKEQEEPKEQTKTPENPQETEKNKNQEEEKPTETEEKNEGLNKVMVKILKEVPEFVSQNLQKQGPYEANSTVKIPEEQAEILVEKGLAKKKEETKQGE